VGSKLKAHKTSGGPKMPVRHTIPLGIVIFLVCFNCRCRAMEGFENIIGPIDL